MNGSTHDIGGTLNAKPSPIPSEARQFVFLPGTWTKDDEGLLLSWVRWGGKSEFVWNPKQASKCGICIFRRGFLDDGRESVLPFFESGGAEANVFEFITEENLFRRVTREHFNLYYPIK